MNKCEVVRDLIPLYMENICSESSRELVENHIKECKECHNIFEEMKSEIIVEPLVLEEEIEKKELLSEGKERIEKEIKKNLLARCTCVDLGINILIFVTAMIYSKQNMETEMWMILVLPLSLWCIIWLLGLQISYLMSVKKGRTSNIARFTAIGSILMKVVVLVLGCVGGIVYMGSLL